MSDQSRLEAYKRLERHLDENYYAGARDDLREVAQTYLTDQIIKTMSDLLPIDYDKDRTSEIELRRLMEATKHPLRRFTLAVHFSY